MAGRIKMMVTGTGITNPYISSLYYDLDTEDFTAPGKLFTLNNRDKLDGRNTKPYHNIVDGKKLFSTKIPKFKIDTPISETEPYATRKCEIVKANKCWIEIGFFHQKIESYNFDGTVVKFRWSSVNNSQWVNMTRWENTGFNGSYIDWDYGPGHTIKDPDTIVPTMLGHIEEVNGEKSYFVDMAPYIFRTSSNSGLVWGFITQSNPYSNQIEWCDRYGVPYTTKYITSDVSGFGLIANSANMQFAADYILNNAVIPDFPYTDTEEGGGEGSQDNTSDDIEIPDAPGDADSQVRGQGMVGVYEITKSASVLLCDFLYNNNVFNTMVKKLYNNPVDAIMDYFYIPIKPKINTSGHIGLCGMDTGISANIVSSMYSEFDFGTISIEEFYGNFLDYEPYTKISIYLPFVGIRELNANLYMNSTLHIVYRVDVMTGCFVCYLEVSQNTQWGVRKQMVNSYSGNMAIHLPLSNISNTMFTQSIITGLSGVASGATQIALGNPMGAITAGASLANMGGSAYMGGTSLETVSRYDGNIGFLGVMYPYVIIERPVANIPFNYGKYNGYNSFIDRKISEVSGFTQVFSIHLDDVTGMLDEEKTELERILKEGITI